MSIDPSRLTSASFIFPIPPRYSAIVSEYVTKFVENPCCSDPVLFVLITSRKTPNLVESYPENMMSLVPSLSTSATSMEFDIDWGSISKGDWLVIDCFRLLDPNEYPRVWNDSFLKKYTVALMKRQWGQNLLKFQGVKLPGGIELNGRQIYDDGEKDLEIIREQMSNMYEMPPLDMIG